MAKPRGNTKKILEKVTEIQALTGKAQGCIDNKQQHEIRNLLNQVHELCLEITGMYDPM